MWKGITSEEYTRASPVVQAHYHVTNTEAAIKIADYKTIEREGRLASEKFLAAAKTLSDKRTIAALLVLAKHHEYQSRAAKKKIPKEEVKNESLKEVMNEEKEFSIETEEGQNVEETRKTVESSVQDTVAMEKEESMKSEEKKSEESTDLSNVLANDALLSTSADEMHELAQRLHTLGLSKAINGTSSILMASRHLSSSLGDSFCLLPTKARTPTSHGIKSSDGSKTMRAAAASRMRHQHSRMMEQQFGTSQDYIDNRSRPRFPIYSTESQRSFNNDINKDGVSNYDNDQTDQLSNTAKQTIAQQKEEIEKLLNTVKALSTENTKLIKTCDALENVQAENKVLHNEMETFKTHYNQKLTTIKHALEEWRRQRNSGISIATASDSTLQSAITSQEKKIRELEIANKTKSDQLARYEKMYKTLREGARAKQLAARSSGTNKPPTSGVVPRASFASSDQFQSGANLTKSDTTDGINRPPAHPNRRKL